MILFWLICAVMIAVALGFILPPLRQPDSTAGEGRIAEVNVAVYRNQLDEMKSDVHHGILTQEQYDLDREELERRLLADIPSSPHGSNAAKPALDSATVTYVIAVGLPLAAILLYLKLGHLP